MAILLIEVPIDLSCTPMAAVSQPPIPVVLRCARAKHVMASRMQTAAVMKKIKTILCPIDFFPASLSAVNYAARLAALNKGTFHLVHIVPPVEMFNTYGYPLPCTPDILRSMQKNATDQMKKLDLRLKKHRLFPITSLG